MNLHECFEKRLLRKGRPDKLKSIKALEIAQRKINKAEQLLEHNFYEEVIVTVYTAMFQCARALLFQDGIFERSHQCVIEYLKENFLKTGKLEPSHIHWLDTYRIERHETLYGFEEIKYSREEADNAIQKGKDFLQIIRVMVENKSSR